MKYELILLGYSILLLPLMAIYSQNAAELFGLPNVINQSGFNKPLESLRGIAAGMVLMAHTTMYFYFEGWGAGYKTSSLTGQGGVTWFFMLTGFLFWHMVLSDRLNLTLFFQKRIYRLVPAMMVMIGCVLLFEWIAAGLPAPAGAQVLAALKNFMFGFAGVNDVFLANAVQRINNIWTLRWEWLFYLCLPLLAALTRSWRGLTLTLLLYLLTMTDVVVAWNKETDAALLVSFYLGMCCAHLHILFVQHPQRYTFVVKLFSGYLGFLLVFGLSCLSLWLPHDLIRSRNLLFVCLNAPLFLWFFMQSHPTNGMRQHQWLNSVSLLTLGKISYSLYLWHLVVSYFVHSLYARQILPGQGGWLEILTMPFFVIFLSVPIAILSYKYVEHPFMSKWKK